MVGKEKNDCNMLSRMRASKEERDWVNTGAVFLLLIIHWANKESVRLFLCCRPQSANHMAVIPGLLVDQ